jgi:acyl-CoA thioesterase
LHAGAFAAESLRNGPPQTLNAELKPDRVVITVAGKLFTEYLFTADSKYPYFFPVNGPRTGRSVTTCRTEPYPHHSPIFLAATRSAAATTGRRDWSAGASCRRR